MPDPVQLTDLDVITRYSIAVRTATADRDELIATLRADLAWLDGGRRSRPSLSSTSRAVRAQPAAAEDYDEEPPARRTTRKTATRTASKKATAKKTSTATRRRSR
ncbi:MAG TPA: hypothetical protein VG708_00355 [Mycobacteriales bacterium]|nr:hypothetical protein [Mycobacteriales bacterium]